jgi:hypothetical protein
VAVVIFFHRRARRVVVDQLDASATILRGGNLPPELSVTSLKFSTEPLVLEGSLEMFTGLPQMPLGLLSFSFGLELVVVGSVADDFLDSSFQSLVSLSA